MVDNENMAEKALEDRRRRDAPKGVRVRDDDDDAGEDGQWWSRFPATVAG